MRQTGISPAQAVTQAIEGAAILFLAVIVSNFHIKLLENLLTPIFLPAAVLFLWPRQADYNTSLWLVFVAGLFQDLTSGTPAGLFALTWLLVWIIIHIDEPDRSVNFKSHWMTFAIIMVITLMISGVLSIIALQAFPSIFTLALQGFLSWLLYPIIHFGRVFVLRYIYGRYETG